jgi:hypothetical protein
MKHPIEKPSESIMKFFNPELYLQFNSPDDAVADRANDAWENAIRNYQRHLKAIRDRMRPEVRKISELCLHDAEILNFERDLTAVIPFKMAILSLKQEGSVHSLIYILWDNIRDYPPGKSWPFSTSRKHWLYDELDVAGSDRGLFLHRILFSDGSVVEIPFISVFVNVVSVADLLETTSAKRIA